MKLTLAILSIVCYLSCHILIEAALQVGFYNDRCSCAESVIREEVTKAFFENKGIAPGIIRLQFHDCFVRVSKISYAVLDDFLCVLVDY